MELNVVLLVAISGYCLLALNAVCTEAFERLYGKYWTLQICSSPASLSRLVPGCSKNLSLRVFPSDSNYRR